MFHWNFGHFWSYRGKSKKCSTLLLASQLLDALRFLSKAKIGHGHLGLRHISQNKDGSLAVSGAGLLQLVHKANDLGFTIIGNGDEFNTFQSNDLVNLAWVEHFSIFGNLIFVITSRSLRIRMEHIQIKNSLDSQLQTISICSIRILNILEVIAKMLNAGPV